MATAHVISSKPTTFNVSSVTYSMANMSTVSSTTQSVNYNSPHYSPHKDDAMVEPETQVNKPQDAINEAIAVQKKAKVMSTRGIKHHDHLVIFLHGYNNSQLDINTRIASIDKKLGTLKVITTAFNWPSYECLFGYTADQEKVEECAGYFISYLNEIRKGDIHKFSQIDIICHSMGNYLLTQTIILCVKGKSLDLFNGCNIICVAADSPYDEYNKAITDAYDHISNWIHYWTNADWALWGSSTVFVNSEDRAGQSECKYKDDENYSKVLSVEWTDTKFGDTDHGYIDEILGNHDPFANDVIKRLNIPNDDEDEVKANPDEEQKEPKDSKSSEFEKYSLLWDKCYLNGEEVSWMTDNFMLEKYADKKTSWMYSGKYGQFKIQRKKGGLWGMSGDDKFKIIYCRDLEENEWKEMDGSNDEEWINNKYNDYMEMMKWKNETMTMVEKVDSLIEMLE